jgi:hypothetical protein
MILSENPLDDEDIVEYFSPHRNELSGIQKGDDSHGEDYGKEMHKLSQIYSIN